MTLMDSVFVGAAISSVGLGTLGLVRRPGGLLRWSFAVGMVGFAAEALAAFVLVSQTDAPDERLLWLKVLEIAGLLLLVPWGVFVATLGRPGGPVVTRSARLGLGAGAGVLLASATAIAYFPAFQVADFAGPFLAARVDVVGRLSVAVQLVVTVLLLAALEAALRASRREERWRIKHLVLGLGGILLIRFYFLSQTVLFNVLMANYVVTGAATLLIGNAAIAASLLRDRLSVQLAVSRQVVYRSVVVAILGVYLLAVGILGWLLNRLGIGEELFWGSVVVFVSALALAAVLLSESVRWRVKRFVARHFYQSKYDYREQWSNFTKRLGSLVTPEDLAPQLLGAIAETIGTVVGILYVRDDQDGRYHPASAVGLEGPSEPLGIDQSAVTEIRTSGTAARVLENGGARRWLEPRIARVFTDGSVIVPLRWRDELIGLLLVGPERTGSAYTPEDLEFLGTVGEQAAGVIATARLSENLARSREFEAFHRLTSFVIHDLKNSISALSMLSENALRNFDDPEFQRDALKTLAKTVARMKSLMARLSSAPEAAALRLGSVDVAGLVVEAISALVKSDRISLVKDLSPVVVSADADALLRVVQNLVTNAAQAIDGRGTVTVRTFEEGGKAVLSVTDTGCGMSEEFVRKSLFAPFRSTKKGGWGIGLYQAKGIVEAHGGTIEVASKEGSGTTMSVRLPVGGRERS